MRLIMKVTAVTKVTDEKLLVQLQGKYGNAQLNLPNSQQASLTVGSEYILGTDEGTLEPIGTIDEVRERNRQALSPMLSPMTPPPRP